MIHEQNDIQIRWGREQMNFIWMKTIFRYKLLIVAELNSFNLMYMEREKKEKCKEFKKN